MKKTVVLLALSLHFFMTTAQSAQDLKYVIAKSTMNFIQNQKAYKARDNFEGVYVQCKLSYLSDEFKERILLRQVKEEAPILQIHDIMLEQGIDIKDYPTQNRDKPRHYNLETIFVDECSPDAINIRICSSYKPKLSRHTFVIPDVTYLYWTYDAAEKQWNICKAPRWWKWN